MYKRYEKIFQTKVVRLEREEDTIRRYHLTLVGAANIRSRSL